ncbi:hypothetical protein K438DRAFT_2071330, partial [Mycena galopus ATCC 62051]
NPFFSITMPLPDTGRYTIINVKFGNFAVLPDADDESDIVAGTEPEHDGEKVFIQLILNAFFPMKYYFIAIQWNVTRLNNGKYTMKNHGFSSGASCEHRPIRDTNLVGDRRRTDQQWIIKETHLFWGLPDREMKTPVSLGCTVILLSILRCIDCAQGKRD